MHYSLAYMDNAWSNFQACTTKSRQHTRYNIYLFSASSFNLIKHAHAPTSNSLLPNPQNPGLHLHTVVPRRNPFFTVLI